MTTSTLSFLVGVEVTSERESAVCDSTMLGIFPQWETMAGGSSRKGLPGFSRLVPKLPVFTCIPLFCQEARSSDFPLPEPCEYDILVVCQHPHALSRNRLVPALAGRTIAA
jgi:hypothetical protein